MFVHLDHMPRDSWKTTNMQTSPDYNNLYIHIFYISKHSKKNKPPGLDKIGKLMFQNHAMRYLASPAIVPLLGW